MNLFIGNLHPDTTDADLRPLFAEFGDIVTVKVIKDNVTGLSRCFGFVEMADKFMAYDAIDNIDGTYLMGNVISVKEAKQSTANGRSGPSAPKPFRPKPAARPVFRPRPPAPDTPLPPPPDGEDFNNSRY